MITIGNTLRPTSATPNPAPVVQVHKIPAITETIMGDTGVSRAPAELLAAGLVGAAVTAAQFWLAGGRQVPKEDAEALMSALAWRGIASFPLQGEAHPID